VISDLEALLAEVRRGGRPKYLFFWGHKAGAPGTVGKECLSQWWPAPFEVEGQRYATAEHFMMAEKARLFGDEAARARILEARSPAAAKRLGREVRPFDERTWATARSRIVETGSFEKFRQNPPLAAFLGGTAERVLVEASPVDRIWGIGLPAGDPHAGDPERWRGLNLLGFALMTARELLRGQGGG
jgi:ribA/ribD-fused uncharacterized protein